MKINNLVSEIPKKTGLIQNVRKDVLQEDKFTECSSSDLSSLKDLHFLDKALFKETFGVSVEDVIDGKVAPEDLKIKEKRKFFHFPEKELLYQPPAFGALLGASFGVVLGTAGTLFKATNSPVGFACTTLMVGAFALQFARQKAYYGSDESIKYATMSRRISNALEMTGEMAMGYCFGIGGIAAAAALGGAANAVGSALGYCMTGNRND